MQPKIGIIGGSGFYEFLNGQTVALSTPFGEPSDKILLANYQGKDMAFLPRHGKKHHLPPHRINYRANLYALKQLGVEMIIAPTAVGSLKPSIAPGSFILASQFINFTHSRKDTFFDGPSNKANYKPNNLFNKVAHISTAEPYCPFLRQIAFQACQALNIPCQENGTVVIIEGPRFSSKAESQFWAQHADIINMTQYPEVVLARELEMCYLNISLVTDYDAGLKDNPGLMPVSAQEVVNIFQQNNEKLKTLILEIIKNITDQPTCSCYQSLKNAFI
jgi:5'-methylthioadenosine phosphorylase